jgi:hypothetical protein
MPTTTTGFVVAVLAVVLVGFVALWVAISFTVASVSGWRRLRRLYATEAFDGPTSRTSGYVGRSRFRGALITGASSAGLYLNVVAPFRIAAGPVLVPWSDVTGPVPSPGLASFVTLEFPRAQTSLRLPANLADTLLRRRREAP